MVGFKKLTSAFEQNSNKNSKPNKDDSSAQKKGMEAVKQSLAIVNTIDKLKAQGISVTKKAELDYLLALRVLERADIDPEQLYQYRVDNKKAKESDKTIGLQNSQPGQQANGQPGHQADSKTGDPAQSLKRTPQDNPEEFEKAMALSKKCIAEVEELLQQGKSVPIEKFEEYDLCKKFLTRYS